MAQIKAIDVSAWQSNIDWSKVKSDGVSVAFLRCTAGSSNLKEKDKFFDINYSGCIKNDIKVGVYRYSYAKTIEQIKEEANGVVSALSGKKITYPVFLDLEWDWQRKNLTKDDFEKFINAFKTIVENAGYTFGIYANVSWLNNILPVSAQNNPLWVARYPNDDDGTVKERLRVSTSNYKNCIAWQYSSKGKVNGINGNVDMDTIYKEYGVSTSSNTNNTEVKGMLEKDMRQSVVNFMVKYVGIAEGSAGHLAILAVFNNSGLCTRYKMTKNDAWCATTVSAAFIANGFAGKAGSGKLFECVECSCNYMIQLAQKQGIWVEKDSYVPKTGDVILYDWQDGTNYATTEDTSGAEHVGIVVSCDGSNIKVIEGNKSNTVGYRTLAVNGRYIRGFITPNYAKFATGSSTTAEVKQTTATPTASTTNMSYVGKGIGSAVSLTAMNVRSGNGTNYSSYGVIGKGTKVEVLEITSNGWFKIVWSGCSAGYAYTSYQNGKYYKYTANATTNTTAKTNTNNSTVSTNYTSSKKATDSAQSYDKSLAGTYSTTANLNIRNGAGTNKSIMCTIPKGTSVKNYGYYTLVNGAKWFYVQFVYNKVQYTGFAHSGYLKK